MNWRLIAPILAIAMCGCVAKVEQPAPAKPAVRSDDPCNLLTAAEATAALGQRVVKTNAPSPSYCRYAAPSLSSNMQLSVVFSVDDDVASYGKFIEREDAAAIAGLGDRAVWNSGGNSVVVIKHNKRLMLSVADGHSPSAVTELELQQKAVAAAQKIADRM